MILASTFERVQIIPGAIHNYVRISCVDCSTDTGKIAAAYENQVCIFEPTPLIHNNSPHVSRLYAYLLLCMFKCIVYLLGPQSLQEPNTMVEVGTAKEEDKVQKGVEQSYNLH